MSERARRFRVVVVGAGPAGSRVAFRLVEHGLDPGDVAIVDRAVFPRQKLCGGAVTFRGTARLAAVGGRPAGGCSTLGLRFVSRYGDWPVREPGEQWLYDRADLDDRLLQSCRDAGIAIREGAPLRAVERDGGGWRLRLADGGELAAAWLVGADGAAGVVRRQLQLRGGGRGRLVEGVFTGAAGSGDARTLLVDFDPILDGIPGYAWVFPYPQPGGALLWKIGVMDGRGAVAGERLRRYTADFAARRGFRPIAGERIRGWPEHYYGFRNRAHAAGAVLVGEAWGVDALLGEGIAPGLAMADYAAPRLARAIRRGRRRIAGYELRFAASEEGRNLSLQGWLADRLYGVRGAVWLRTLYGIDIWREALGSGRIAYGRLTRSLPVLAAAARNAAGASRISA